MSSRESGRERLGAATGLFAAIALLAAFLVTPRTPDVDSEAQVASSYFLESQDEIRIGLLLFAISIGLLIWFLGTLRSVFGAAEGGTERLARILFGAGLVSVGALAFEATTVATAAFRPAETTPELTRSIWDLGIMMGGAASFAFAAFFAAAALAIERTGLLPAWVGRLSAVTAVGTAFGVSRIFADSGIFSADGFLGFVVGFALFLVWLGATSIELMRRV